MMKIIPKHNLLDAFIEAYDEELFSLPSSIKLIYVSDIKETSKDNYEKIKSQANDIPNWLPEMYQFKYILLDEDLDEIYMKFEYGNTFNEYGRPIDFKSKFKFYDKNNNEICIVEMPSILAIVHGKLHEDSIIFKVIKEVDGQIIGLKNKYNDEFSLLTINRTYKYIKNIYDKIGEKNRIEIRDISIHNEYEFNMLNSIDDYYKGCLCARMFHSIGKTPLISYLDESENEYSKIFFKLHGLSNLNIDLVLTNLKNIYTHLQEKFGVNVSQSFLAYDYFDFQKIIYTQPRILIESEEVQIVFAFFVGEKTTTTNFEEQDIYFDNYFCKDLDRVFKVHDLLHNKKEMFDYLETISY